MRRKTNKLLAKEIINREIAALKRTANLIDNDFEKACDILLGNKGKVIVLGLGKSSFIAMKMAATLSSTGTSAGRAKIEICIERRRIPALPEEATELHIHDSCSF